MNRIPPVILSLLLVRLLIAEDSYLLFDQSIRPILADKCIQCHGPDESKREADLRLDVATRDPQQKKALEASLWERVSSTDPDFQMPPPATGKPLTDSDRSLIKQWIESGAEFNTHWAYRPIEHFDPQDPNQPTIDTLVERGLVEKGIQRASAITKSQWLRRAYIDLIGIPPTWDEVESFEKDDSSVAREQVIDRLLASTAYGQRWGKYWLDLARYADTHGGAAIGFSSFPFSYTYRDYVIQAFNEDRPYNEFIVEQLAADQMELEPNDARLAALGFLTVGMRFRNSHDILDDQIDVITRGLMGLTVTCARCHDHKFDTIPTRDYYSIYAALSPSAAPEDLPIIGQPGTDEASKQKTDAYLQKLESLKTQHAEMARDQIEVMKSRLRMQFGMYLRELAKGTPEQDVATTFLSYRTDDIRPIVYNRWRSYLSSLRPDDAVFGIWYQLAELPADQFSSLAQSLLESRLKEIPDKAKASEYHALAAAAPKWNPLVVEAILEKKPASMLDVADAYGDLFARIHQDWLKALHELSLEAVSSETVVPDEDAKHQMVNSPVYRQLRRHLYGPGTPTDLSDEIASQLLNRTIEDSVSGKRGAIHNHHLTDPGSLPRAMVLEEESAERESFVFLRGNHMARGESVQPGFLSAISNGSAAFDSRPGMRRMALAQAIVAKDNPLTRRVIVNWIWQQHFGQGLVRSTDDFGTRGTPPSNPKLLDYLADVFRQDGWSIKSLHRRIMLSQTYASASVEIEASRKLDPENDRLWRMTRRRLDFESMRDSMLHVSGELDLSPGGRPIDLATSPAIPRRTVYGFVNRDIISNLSSTFDSANPNACTLKRPDTLVPQQTLFALNSEFIQERAAKLASLVTAANLESNLARVEWLYRRIFLRSPSPDEIEIACRFVEREHVPVAGSVATTDAAPEPSGGTDLTGDPSPSNSSVSPERPLENRWQSLAHAMLASNEFSFVD